MLSAHEPSSRVASAVVVGALRPPQALIEQGKLGQVFDY